MELLLVITVHLLLLSSSSTYTDAATADIPCKDLATDPVALKDADRGAVLQLFNEIREHIVGDQTFDNYQLKKAKNMYKLFWDCKMEKKLIEAIDPAKGKMTLTKKYAQNYAIFVEPSSKKAEDCAKEARTRWFNEVKYIGLDKNQTYKAGLDFFANMVNAKATQIACAYKDDGATPKNIHFSCIFNVKPVKGQSIYEKGKPCTKNKQCTTYPGSNCDPDLNLCEYRGDIPESDATAAAEVTTAASVTTAGAATNAAGATTKASEKSGTAYMTEAARTKVVDAHNYRRGLLTTGQIQNGKNPSNANLPTGAFMSKMEYDMILEAQAAAYAQQCTMTKSAESTRTGYGENVYVHTTMMRDTVELFRLAVINWWRQIFQDGINRQLIFKQSLRDKFKEKGIDQTAFTQMAWARTSKIGCATADCSGKSFVVCRYSPAGNILDQPIYEIGYVCRGCTGTCNPADGLCIK